MPFRTSRVQPRILQNARAMRRKPASAEQELWFHLRNRKLGGFKFRRQYPVDNYVADFCCAECILILELDGESHDRQEAYDLARTEGLRKKGFEVLRFRNTDVHENMEGVLREILRECQRRSALARGPAPHPNPLP